MKLPDNSKTEGRCRLNASLTSKGNIMIKDHLLKASDLNNQVFQPNKQQIITESQVKMQALR